MKHGDAANSCSAEVEQVENVGGAGTLKAQLEDWCLNKTDPCVGGQRDEFNSSLFQGKLRVNLNTVEIVDRNRMLLSAA